jgi:hypothetical protein
VPWHATSTGVASACRRTPLNLEAGRRDGSGVYRRLILMVLLLWIFAPTLAVA